VEAIRHSDGIVTARLADAGCAGACDSATRCHGRGKGRIAMTVVHGVEQVIERLHDRHFGHLAILNDKP